MILYSKNLRRIGIAAVSAVLLAGCDAVNGSAFDLLSAPATIVPPTKTGIVLDSLPKAARPLDVAVYTFPDLTGQSPRAGQINLTQRGLEPGTVALLHLPDLPPDQIIGQSPPPNAEGVATPKVNLLVTAPAPDQPRYYVMPDFSGRRLGEATGAMAESGLGFHVGKVAVHSASAGNSARLKPIATDIITSQFPPAGQKIGAGAAINFEGERRP